MECMIHAGQRLHLAIGRSCSFSVPGSQTARSGGQPRILYASVYESRLLPHPDFIRLLLA